MEIWQLTANELRQKILKCEISAREATESHLSRMDQVNVKINAVAQSCETEALKEADLIDDKCLRGDELGALAGVPVTVKINVDQRGYATTNGLQLQKDLVAKIDNPVVNNLRKAGLSLSAGPIPPHFRLDGSHEIQFMGHTKNPLNPLVTPGGSSGGAAAAVAAE